MRNKLRHWIFINWAFADYLCWFDCELHLESISKFIRIVPQRGKLKIRPVWQNGHSRKKHCTKIQFSYHAIKPCSACSNLIQVKHSFSKAVINYKKHEMIIWHFWVKRRQNVWQNLIQSIENWLDCESGLI